MLKSLSLLTAGLALAFTFNACKQEDPDPDQPALTTYTFSDAQAQDGHRAVVLAIDNLNTLVKSARGNSITEAQLLTAYASTNPGVTPVMTADASLETLDALNGDSTKAQFKRIAANSGASPATGYVADSLDLSQITVKNLWGNVVLKQLVTLLNTAPSANNNEASTQYTDAEKAWDRAFGISGFTYDALLYTKDQKALTLKQRDNDNDGTLARRWETNYLFAHYAMRIDAEASWGGNFPAVEQFDFTGTIMNSFIKGRSALSAGNTAAANAEAQKIIKAYEHLAAVSILHYLRIHQPLISNPAEQGLTGKRISNWSETVAFINILEAMPSRTISSAQISQLRNFFGKNTFAMDEKDRTDARNLLQSIYNFTTYQFNNI